jgi:hypothetical protein
MDIADEYADPDHDMGITEEAYEQITDALMGFGDDVDIRKD